MLSQKELNELFEYRDGLLIWKKDRKHPNRKAGDVAGQSSFRPMVRIGSMTRRVHIIIWVMFNGPIPEGFEIDHKDTDKQNNRIENLRLVTRQQNLFNRKVFPKTKSGFKGVVQQGRKWVASMTINRQHLHIGTFDSPEEASLAYNLKALEVHGEYANF